jgi:RNA polymerase sigma-70 factor (ECF subfamily)
MPESTTSTRPMASEVEARFRQMVTQEYTFIWRTLRGLGVPASSVDDAAQQVFLVAAQKFDAVAIGSERAFLFSTARGVAANARRAAARSREIGDDDVLAIQPDHAPNPEQLTAAKHATEILERILDGMTEDLRTAFVLHELEGVTMAVMAELLGVPPGTVASRIRRAREQFESAASSYRTGGGAR